MKSLKERRRGFCLVCAVLLLPAGHLRAQVNNGGIYIDPNPSDPKERRSAIISGNRVEMYVTNFGWLGRCGTEGPGGGIWPRGTDHDHLHSLSPFMAAAVRDRFGNPVKVVSEGYSAQSKRDPITNIDQKFHPIPGYRNDRQGQDELANQLNPDSWPPSWPGKDQRWSGYWNGYFGLNQKNADQEAYFVMDDRWNNKIPYYPSNTDTTLRGLGLQVEVREFQWSHPLAQDVIFAHYQVSNIGTHDYLAGVDSLYFGGYADINPGGCGASDDDAYFDLSYNMVYAWDHDNIGVWSKFREIPPGYMAWKFLETPGLPDDGVDNDADGLIDERRDNDAGSYLFGPVGNYGPPKWHWSGDEEGDWNPAIDDKGTDGSAPGDEGYPGPDPDGTEGNGRPDQGEPNFGKTDKDESDQVGLASFSAPRYGTAPITEELDFWPRIRRGNYSQPPMTANQYWVFSAGPFDLKVGRTERFSVCVLFGSDRNAIFRSAQVAQRIYDADYQFAKPPSQPTLQAIAGDRKVTLIWNSKAEQSRDPIYHYDFEGYKIYKSTEPQFLEPTVITDGYGNKVFKQPVAQFDLIDSLTGMHPLQLGDEVGDQQGIHYFMGTDNGLQHHWVDTNVINGRTYYYAVAAYDRGYAAGFYERGLSDNPNLIPITPSESPASIIVTGGVITHMDPNTAMATPRPFPSNYAAGGSDGDTSAAHRLGFSSGTVTTAVISPQALHNRKFIVTFTDTLLNKVDRSGLQVEIQTQTYSIYDSTTQTWICTKVPLPETPVADSVVRGIKQWTAELFDYGVAVTFTNTLATEQYAQEHSGWEHPPANTTVTSVRLDANYSPLLPMNVVIEWGDSTEILDTAYTGFNSVNPSFRRPVNFRLYELGSNERVRCVIQEGQSTKNGRIDKGENLVIVVPKPNSYVLTPTWRVTFAGPADSTVAFIAPLKGERYVVRPAIPFGREDLYEFNTTESVVRTNESVSILDRVSVVPNPYIEAAIWEQQPYLRGRGERKIFFINLPAQCVVRIYTVNGYLLREITHDGTQDASGSVSWDLTTRDGLEVASGLYVYHVEATGIGSKVGKFAIVN